MQVKKQQLEPDVEQWTGPKLGMGYIKVVYCHLAYLTYMQSTSSDNARLDEAQAGIRIAGRNINNLRYADYYHPYGRKQRRTKEPIDTSERAE